MLIMPRNEDALIDSMRGRTIFPTPVVTQADNPGEDLSRVGGTTIPELPDPAVGGQNGSRIRNGFSLGFRGRLASRSPFLGLMAKPPAIRNAVQGEVGAQSRSTSLYVAVMDQQATYTADGSALARSITGV